MSRTSPKAVRTFSENKTESRKPHMRVSFPGKEGDTQDLSFMHFMSCLASVWHGGKSPLAWSQRSSHFFSLKSQFPESENWNLANRATLEVTWIRYRNVLRNTEAPLFPISWHALWSLVDYGLLGLQVLALDPTPSWVGAQLMDAWWMVQWTNGQAE